VCTNHTVPTAAYERRIYSCGGRHGTSTIIILSNERVLWFVLLCVRCVAVWLESIHIFICLNLCVLLNIVDTFVGQEDLVTIWKYGNQTGVQQFWKSGQVRRIYGGIWEYGKCPTFSIVISEMLLLITPERGQYFDSVICKPSSYLNRWNICCRRDWFFCGTLSSIVGLTFKNSGNLELLEE